MASTGSQSATVQALYKARLEGRGAVSGCGQLIITMQVQLTVLCEDDSKNVMTDTDNCIETRPVALSEFGAYVQEMHSNNNSGFWDQFFVSALFFLYGGCGL